MAKFSNSFSNSYYHTANDIVGNDIKYTLSTIFDSVDLICIKILGLLVTSFCTIQLNSLITNNSILTTFYESWQDSFQVFLVSKVKLGWDSTKG